MLQATASALAAVPVATCERAAEPSEATGHRAPFKEARPKSQGKKWRKMGKMGARLGRWWWLAAAHAHRVGLQGLRLERGLEQLGHARRAVVDAVGACERTAE